ESGRDESEVSELRFDERKALFPRRRGGPALRTRLAGRGFVRGARFFGAGGRPAEQLLEQRAERFSVDRARSPAADRFLDGESDLFLPGGESEDPRDRLEERAEGLRIARRLRGRAS